MTSKILDQKITSLYTIEQLHERSAPLFQSSLFKGRLYVNPKTGELDSDNPVKIAFKKIFQGYQAGPNSPLVQMKVLQLLENVKHLITSEEDQKLAQDLAKRAGKEASKLFNSPSFQAGTASKEFFNAHQRELQPFHQFIAFTNEEVSVPKFDQQEPTQQDLFENNQQENETNSDLSNGQQNSEFEQEQSSSAADSITFSSVPLHNENEVSCNLPEDKITGDAPKAGWTRRALLVGTFSVGALVALGFIFRDRLFPLPNPNTIDPTVTNSGGSPVIENNSPTPVETPAPAPAPAIVLPNPQDFKDPVQEDNQDPVFTPSDSDKPEKMLTADFLDGINKTSENNSTNRASYLTKFSKISLFNPLLLVTGAIAGLGVIYLCRGKNKPGIPSPDNKNPLHLDKKDLIIIETKKIDTSYELIIGTSLDLIDPYDDVENSSYNQTGCKVDVANITVYNTGPRRLLRLVIECAIENHGNFGPLLEVLKESLSTCGIDNLRNFQKFIPTLKEKLKDLKEFNNDHPIDGVINELMEIINPKVFNETHVGYLDMMKGHEILINRDDDIDISNLDEHSTDLDDLTNPLTLLRYFIECRLSDHPLKIKVCELLNDSFKTKFDEQDEMLLFLTELYINKDTELYINKDNDNNLIENLINTLANTTNKSKQDPNDPLDDQLLPQQPQPNSSDDKLSKIENNNPNNDKDELSKKDEPSKIKSDSVNNNKIDVAQLKNEFAELCNEFGNLCNARFEIEEKLSLSTANAGSKDSTVIAITSNDPSTPKEDLPLLNEKLEENRKSFDNWKIKFDKFDTNAQLDTRLKDTEYSKYSAGEFRFFLFQKIVTNLESLMDGNNVIPIEVAELIQKLNYGLELLEKNSKN